MAPSRDESSSATGRSSTLQRRPPSASRGIAGEVLAAERAAVLASLGEGRRLSSTPRAPPAVSASVLRAALTSSARKSGLRNGGSVNASPTSVAATPPSRSSDAVMSADLWAMAHTPPPTEARRTLGYHPLGPTREEPATAPPTEAATDARRRVAALSEAAAAAVEDGLRRLASARRATGGVEEGILEFDYVSTNVNHRLLNMPPMPDNAFELFELDLYRVRMSVECHSSILKQGKKTKKAATEPRRLLHCWHWLRRRLMHLVTQH